MKKLYKMKFSCGRMGTLEGLFIKEEVEVNKLVELETEVYFGEVLGKHSEVCGPIEESEIKIIEISTETLNELESIFGETVSGYNPFEYLEE